MRPILFLDFDDVVCLNSTYGGYDALLALREVQKGEAKVADFQNMWDVLFDKACVENLRLINAEFTPTYVVSSSWTRFMDKETLTTVLLHGGLPFVCDNLHPDWETVKTASPLRSKEVDHWLDCHPEHKANWVAIDDAKSGTGWIDGDTGESNNEFVVFCEIGVGLRQIEYCKLRSAFQKRKDGLNPSPALGV